MAAEAGVNVRFKRIPRETLEKKAVEQGDIRFFEPAALSLRLSQADREGTSGQERPGGRHATVMLTDFIMSLEDVPDDVRAWCKIPESFKFSIEYTDPRANLRYYYPDFIAVDENGRHWLIETKGAETVEVAYKDEAARAWCDNATELSDTTWMYVKVAQTDFHQMQPGSFGDITLLR